MDLSCASRLCTIRWARSALSERLVCNTVFSDDYNPLYRNDGNANFTDISYQLGIAEVSVPFLSWGDAFIDYDNNGWKIGRASCRERV